MGQVGGGVLSSVADQILNRYALLRAIRLSGVVELAELRKYLWRDETGDVFLLTYGAEVFLYRGYKAVMGGGEGVGVGSGEGYGVADGDIQLGVYTWSRDLLSVLRQSGLILHEKYTSDRFYLLVVDIRFLPVIMALGGSLKKRPDVRGSFVCTRARMLGHQILPFNPELESVWKERG